MLERALEIDLLAVFCEPRWPVARLDSRSTSRSYATASFKSEGFWKVHADPEGKPYDVR